MNFTVEQPGIVGVLAAEGELTIQRAGELRTALINSLESVSHVMLDFRKVTEVDLTCLQLLCSAHLTSKRAKKRLTIVGSSGPFKQAMVDAGYSCNKGCIFECKKSCLMTEGGN